MKWRVGKSEIAWSSDSSGQSALLPDAMSSNFEDRQASNVQVMKAG